MNLKLTADFETTVDESDCRVWAYALATIEDEPVITYGNSIDQFFDEICEFKTNLKIYFHNLKFDGEFILSYLLAHGFEWVENSKQAKEFTFTTLITSTGLFYKIEVYFKKSGHHTHKVTFLDSLKLLRFSVEEIAKDFKLPIQKLEIDYKEKRPIGHILTDQEIAYISNDVGIMARALNIMFTQGLTKITIGSNALADFKNTCADFRRLFPEFGKELDKDIRKAYRGGWTYLNPDYKEKMVGKGLVIDKNSMYPSQMYYEYLPVGRPVAFKGQYADDSTYPLYIQNISCSFKLKPNKLPCIQIKNGFVFKINEWLTSSKDQLVNLTLSSLDLQLFLENYDVEDLVYHNGWKFHSANGVFKEYIDKWTNSKIEAKQNGNTANYIISKLMLNNLYGKLGSSPISIAKQPYLDDNGVVHYKILPPDEKPPVYIPQAVFITSYARSNIIRTAQKIVDYSLAKYGKNLFVYSDTDSIHALITKEDLENLKAEIELDPYKLGAWDCETEFTRAKFLRQKCYMEEVDHELNVHIAGLPRQLAKFLNFDNFKIGFTTADLPQEQLAGYEKLTYKHVKGGVILKETDFTIKDK